MGTRKEEFRRRLLPFEVMRQLPLSSFPGLVVFVSIWGFLLVQLFTLQLVIVGEGQITSPDWLNLFIFILLDEGRCLLGNDYDSGDPVTVYNGNHCLFTQIFFSSAPRTHF